MSEKAIAFVSAEKEALDGLPLMQRWLYMVLRWYMDRATGRVGDTRGISLQSLAEELYVEPVRGRHAADCGSPSKKAVRSALDGLEREGLIRPCGNGEVLVFFLPKARCVSARSKDEGHMRGTDEGHSHGMPQSRASKENAPYEGFDEGHTQTPDEGHTSRERVNHPYTEASAAAQAAPVDKSALLVLPLQAERVVEWIRLQELERGCRAKVTPRAPLIAAWLGELAVTGEELHEAYSLAKIDREVTKNRAAINLPFLDIFVRRVVGERRVSKGKVSLGELWHTSWEGLNRKAVELGIPVWDRHGSEGFSEYQQRVMQAHRRAQSAQEVAYA